MANIRKELGRHDWRPQKLDKHLFAERSTEPQLLCWNCRIGWDPSKGDPPVVGCLTDIQVRRVGKTRMHDYHRQEQVLLQSRREAEARFERAKEQEYEEYVREMQRRRR